MIDNKCLDKLRRLKDELKGRIEKLGNKDQNGVYNAQ